MFCDVVLENLVNTRGVWQGLFSLPDMASRFLFIGYNVNIGEN